MAAGDAPLDWGMGEHLAFATLLSSGYGVRLSGQDSGRGMFSRIELVTGPAIAATEALPQRLQTDVAALRGDMA